MAEKISLYVADATSDPIKATDLLDFSNWDGAAFDVSKKITVGELNTYLATIIKTIYSADDTTGAGRAISITDTLSFGTSLFDIDETNATVNLGFGLLAVDKTNGTINIKGAIDNTVRLTLRGLGATNATTSVLVEDSAASEMFSINDAGDVSSRDGYWLGADLFLHNKLGAANSTFGGVDSGELATGLTNTGFGKSTLKVLTTGTQCNAFGGSAMQAATTSIACAAFGSSALVAVTGASHNNTAMGAKSYQQLTSGSSHTGLGASSGVSVTGGTGTTSLGLSAGGDANGSFSYSIALGANARFDSSNQMVVGSSSSAAYINNVHWGAGIEVDAIAAPSFTEHVTNITGGAGNTDIASGYDWIRNASAGTGTGLGGSHIFKTAPVGTTSATQNAQVTAFTIQGDGVSVFKSYTLATLPTVVAAGQIYVSDATGSGLTGSLCFSNGTVWIDPTTGIAVA